MLGPVLGGVLVAVTGPSTAFAVDAGSYLVSAVTLLALSMGYGLTQREFRDFGSAPEPADA
jgi:hypothetical protein